MLSRRLFISLLAGGVAVTLLLVFVVLPGLGEDVACYESATGYGPYTRNGPLCGALGRPLYERVRPAGLALATADTGLPTDPPVWNYAHAWECVSYPDDLYLGGQYHLYIEDYPLFFNIGQACNLRLVWSGAAGLVPDRSLICGVDAFIVGEFVELHWFVPQPGNTLKVSGLGGLIDATQPHDALAPDRRGGVTGVWWQPQPDGALLVLHAQRAPDAVVDRLLTALSRTVD